MPYLGSVYTRKPSHDPAISLRDKLREKEGDGYETTATRASSTQFFPVERRMHGEKSIQFLITEQQKGNVYTSPRGRHETDVSVTFMKA